MDGDGRDGEAEGRGEEKREETQHDRPSVVAPADRVPEWSAGGSNPGPSLCRSCRVGAWRARRPATPRRGLLASGGRCRGGPGQCRGGGGRGQDGHPPLHCHFHTLAHLHATAARSVPRTVGPDDRFWDLTPDMLEGVTPEQLFAAYQKAITPRPTPVIDLFHVAPIRTSVIDTVADLCVELPRRGAVSFRELTSSLVDRLDVVVHFLAVLELFKQGLVDLHQPQTFGDIRISWIAGDSDALGDLALVDAYDG